MRINRHDTNGVKPLLGKGELGYDDYSAGGDAGRVYVGTGTENIALAEKLEANTMTKAQFNALAEERKANRAGSGFDEMGKHFNNVSFPNVNEGLWTGSSVQYANKFQLGTTTTIAGVSKSLYPLVNVNGVVSKIFGVAYENTDRVNPISLPQAPTIYPYGTTLTAEQIASGVITHADASNSGLIVNGKFDVDTSGWTSLNASILVENGKLKATNTTTGTGYVYQSKSFVIGKKYVIEFEQQYGNRQGAVRVGTTNIGGEIFNEYSGDTTGALTKHRVEFIATQTTLYITAVVSDGTIGNYRYFDNIAVYPADAISRSDLVFLESWHEDISEKNFVYPLGNVQYLGADTDGLTGIANGAFTGFETYSLFGNFQASSALIGKGYVWSTLTEAQKKAFISNPDNNCYLDGDKTIQVRYRVRVVQGLGDNWDYPFYNMIDGGGSNPPGSAATYSISSNFYIKPKGKLPSITYDISGYASYETGFFANKNYKNITTNYEIGMGTAVNKAATSLDTGVAYEGKCFALPITLVHRRNQGAYHPVYNPNGTAYEKSITTSGSDKWYASSNGCNNIVNISQCFTLRSSGENLTGYMSVTGSIASTYSGRPDGLFYDQVHESDILDLRNSSKKVEDYNRLINREFNKLVAGAYRGKEGEKLVMPCPTIMTVQPNTWSTATGYSSTVRTVYTGASQVSSNVFYEAKQVGGIYDAIFARNTTSGNVYKVLGVKYYTNGTYIYFDHSYGTIFTDTTSTYDIFIVSSSTRTKSNTLLHCDIIGNPTNYPTVWKQSGVFGTPLIVAEDGTSLLPDGGKDTFKLSRKANTTPLLCLRSTDSGATWTSFTPTFSTTTNEITLTNEPTANLVMVYYQTHTSMAVPAVNSEILEIGDVFATNGTYSSQGSVLANTLIGKTPIGMVVPVSMYKGKPMGYKFYNSPIDKLDIVAGYEPIHPTVSGFGTTVSPTIKAFPYLTRTNGKAYLNLVFKEMKHNGTTWGDHDNTFNIVDNVSTTTDGNGATILIGQKTVELPYFIGADE